MGLLCAVADIGRAAYLGWKRMSRPRPPAAMRPQRAAQGDKVPDGASALSAALEQAPGLAGEGVSCSIEVDCSPVRTKEVERKTFDRRRIASRDGWSGLLTGRWT